MTKQTEKSIETKLHTVLHDPDFQCITRLSETDLAELILLLCIVASELKHSDLGESWKNRPEIFIGRMDQYYLKHDIFRQIVF